jgi:hypothetical protein
LGVDAYAELFEAHGVRYRADAAPSRHGAGTRAARELGVTSADYAVDVEALVR